MNKFLVLIFVTVFIFNEGCNDGSIIGNDLLEGEALDLDYRDDFIVSGRTIKGDSIATFRRFAINQTYLLGELDDPIFGKSSSDIYTAFRFGAPPLPDFERSEIDSVVLELEYDSIGFYGSSDVVHNFEVFRVLDDFSDEDTIYSDRSFMFDMIPLGSKSIVPNRIDSIEFQERNTEVDSFITIAARLNIRLDDIFGTQILEDTSAARNDSILRDNFKGLYIKSTTEGSSLIGCNFNENDNAEIAKLAIYYTKTNLDLEEEKKTYNYRLRSETFSQFILDNASYDVGNALNDPEKGKEFLYVQGLSGVNCSIDLPDLSEFDETLINSVQLVLTIAEGEEFFTDMYPAGNRFLLSKEDVIRGGRILIDDVIKEGLTLTNGLILLGGTATETELSDGSMGKTVTFNMTDFIRNSLDKGDFTPRVFVSPVGRSESPQRTIFYGTEHPLYPVKLKIAYTKI